MDHGPGREQDRIVGTDRGYVKIKQRRGGGAVCASASAALPNPSGLIAMDAWFRLGVNRPKSRHHDNETDGDAYVGLHHP